MTTATPTPPSPESSTSLSPEVLPDALPEDIDAQVKAVKDALSQAGEARLELATDRTLSTLKGEVYAFFNDNPILLDCLKSRTFRKEHTPTNELIGSLTAAHDRLVACQADAPALIEGIDALLKRTQPVVDVHQAVGGKTGTKTEMLDFLSNKTYLKQGFFRSTFRKSHTPSAELVAGLEKAYAAAEAVNDTARLAELDAAFEGAQALVPRALKDKVLEFFDATHGALATAPFAHMHPRADSLLRKDHAGLAEVDVALGGIESALELLRAPGAKDAKLAAVARYKAALARKLTRKKDVANVMSRVAALRATRSGGPIERAFAEAQARYDQAQATRDAGKAQLAEAVALLRQREQEDDDARAAFDAAEAAADLAEVSAAEKAVATALQKVTAAGYERNRLQAALETLEAGVEEAERALAAPATLLEEALHSRDAEESGANGVVVSEAYAKGVKQAAIAFLKADPLLQSFAPTRWFRNDHTSSTEMKTKLEAAKERLDSTLREAATRLEAAKLLADQAEALSAIAAQKSTTDWDDFKRTVNARIARVSPGDEFEAGRFYLVRDGIVRTSSPAYVAKINEVLRKKPGMSDEDRVELTKARTRFSVYQDKRATKTAFLAFFQAPENAIWQHLQPRGGYSPLGWRASHAPSSDFALVFTQIVETLQSLIDSGPARQETLAGHLAKMGARVDMAARVATAKAEATKLEQELRDSQRQVEGFLAETIRQLDACEQRKASRTARSAVLKTLIETKKTERETGVSNRRNAVDEKKLGLEAFRERRIVEEDEFEATHSADPGLFGGAFHRQSYIDEKRAAYERDAAAFQTRMQGEELTLLREIATLERDLDAFDTRTAVEVATLEAEAAEFDASDERDDKEIDGLRQVIALAKNKQAALAAVSREVDEIDGAAPSTAKEDVAAWLASEPLLSNLVPSRVARADHLPTEEYTAKLDAAEARLTFCADNSEVLATVKGFRTRIQKALEFKNLKSKRTEAKQALLKVLEDPDHPQIGNLHRSTFRSLIRSEHQSSKALVEGLERARADALQRDDKTRLLEIDQLLAKGAPLATAKTVKADVIQWFKTNETRLGSARPRNAWYSIRSDHAPMVDLHEALVGVKTTLKSLDDLLVKLGELQTRLLHRRALKDRVETFEKAAKEGRERLTAAHEQAKRMYARLDSELTPLLKQRTAQEALIAAAGLELDTIDAELARLGELLLSKQEAQAALVERFEALRDPDEASPAEKTAAEAAVAELERQMDAGALEIEGLQAKLAAERAKADAVTVRIGAAELAIAALEPKILELLELQAHAGKQRDALEKAAKAVDAAFASYKKLKTLVVYFETLSALVEQLEWVLTLVRKTTGYEGIEAMGRASITFCVNAGVQAGKDLGLIDVSARFQLTLVLSGTIAITDTREVEFGRRISVLMTLEAKARVGLNQEQIDSVKENVLGGLYAPPAVLLEASASLNCSLYDSYACHLYASDEAWLGAVSYDLARRITYLRNFSQRKHLKSLAASSEDNDWVTPLVEEVLNELSIGGKAATLARAHTVALKERKGPRELELKRPIQARLDASLTVVGTSVYGRDETLSARFHVYEKLTKGERGRWIGVINEELIHFKNPGQTTGTDGDGESFSWEYTDSDAVDTEAGDDAPVPTTYAVPKTPDYSTAVYHRFTQARDGVDDYALEFLDVITRLKAEEEEEAPEQPPPETPTLSSSLMAARNVQQVRQAVSSYVSTIEAGEAVDQAVAYVGGLDLAWSPSDDEERTESQRRWSLARVLDRCVTSEAGKAGTIVFPKSLSNDGALHGGFDVAKAGGAPHGVGLAEARVALAASSALRLQLASRGRSRFEDDGRRRAAARADFIGHAALGRPMATGVESSWEHRLEAHLVNAAHAWHEALRKGEVGPPRRRRVALLGGDLRRRRSGSSRIRDRRDPRPRHAQLFEVGLRSFEGVGRQGRRRHTVGRLLLLALRGNLRDLRARREDRHRRLCRARPRRDQSRQRAEYQGAAVW